MYYYFYTPYKQDIKFVIGQILVVVSEHCKVIYYYYFLKCRGYLVFLTYLTQPFNSYKTKERNVHCVPPITRD